MQRVSVKFPIFWKSPVLPQEKFLIFSEKSLDILNEFKNLWFIAKTRNSQFLSKKSIPNFKQISVCAQKWLFQLDKNRQKNTLAYVSYSYSRINLTLKLLITTQQIPFPFQNIFDLEWPLTFPFLAPYQILFSFISSWTSTVFKVSSFSDF